MPSRTLMRVEFERCRTFGHMWDDYHPHGKRPPNWGMRFSLRCVRCGTERHDVIDALGALSTRQYVYPDEYAMARDELPTRNAMRLDLLKVMRAEARERRANRRAS